MALLHKAVERRWLRNSSSAFAAQPWKRPVDDASAHAEMLGVSPANREWVNRRCVPQALATFEMPVLLSGKIEKVKRRLYILADGWTPVRSDISPRSMPGARMGRHQAASGHDVMVDLPNELAAALAKIA